MILTDAAEIEETRKLLADAKQARHRIMLGQNVASFRDQNGEQVDYSKANLKDLDSYILELKGLLGLSDYSGQGPMRVFFG